MIGRSSAARYSCLGFALDALNSGDIFSGGLSKLSLLSCCPTDGSPDAVLTPAVPPPPATPALAEPVPKVSFFGSL